MDLREPEYTKRLNEYIEELCKKDINDPDNHDGVITHLEIDILKCEVKRALRSIPTSKTSGGDGIAVELFQILKDDTALNMLANFENSAVATGMKRSFSLQSQRKAISKNVHLPHSCTHLTCYQSSFSKQVFNST